MEIQTMFKQLYELALKAGPLSMTVSADASEGRMTVVVIPKGGAARDEAALATPLSLTATPEDFDTGFVAALTSYSDQRASLEEQVAATNEVLAAAKAASAQKGAAAVSKAAGQLTRTKTKSATRDDDAPDGNDAAGGEGGDTDAGACPSVAPAAATKVGAATGAPNLFG
jgi:PRTRC genetic system protein E